MWSMTAGQIAELTGGELHGAPEVEVSGAAPLEKAGQDDVAFLAEEKHLKSAEQSKAGILLAARALEEFDGTQVICSDPELAFSRVLKSLHQALFPAPPAGISDRAVISEEAELGENLTVGACSIIEAGAKIGDNVVIYPLAYIGRNARIGPDSIIYPHATVCDRAEIGARCSIHAHAVIGDEGFGLIQREGRSIRMKHVGATRIGDDVEVGGLSTIDRGMIQDTVIGDGVKIDKHCHVSHNCVVEEHCVLVGYARMAGSVRIGRGALLAADVQIRDHVEIGEGAVLAAGTGAARDVPAGAQVWGTPPRPLQKEIRIKSLIGRLPQMKNRIQNLEKQVEKLQEQLGEVQ